MIWRRQDLDRKSHLEGEECELALNIVRACGMDAISG